MKYTCSMETVQQNGRFTLFSSKFLSIYSILYGFRYQFFYIIGKGYYKIYLKLTRGHSIMIFVRETCVFGRQPRSIISTEISRQNKVNWVRLKSNMFLIIILFIYELFRRIKMFWIYDICNYIYDIYNRINIFSINVELTSTFLLYRGLVNPHHQILNH